MNIMIICVVAKEVLERVPRESESAMIIDSLRRRDAEEEDILSNRQIGDHVSEESAASVENESFDWVIVECSESIGNVESVVPAVNCSVEEGDLMSRSMHHVLPSIENEPKNRKSIEI